MLRVRSMMLAVALVLAASAAGGSAASAAPSVPGLGTNVVVFDPSMPVGQIQATVDAIHAQQVDDEMGTNRYALLFKPGVYGSARAAAADEGRLLHRGRRPRRVADRRDDQRQDRGLQPLPRRRGHEQLPRPRQLLAHAVQPVAEHQRRRAGRLSRLGELLGRLAGRVDAPPQHRGRQPLADGLLHGRAAVRERRLHRRLEPAVRHQRLAAAVADPQQRDRRLVERRVEPGLRGRRGRAVGRRRSRTRRTRPSTRRPSAARSRTCSSTRRATTTSACPSAQTEHERHHLGRRHDGRDARSRSATSSSRSRRTRCRRSTASWPAARTCCSPQASTTSARASPSSAPTRSSSASGTRRSPRSNGAVPLTVADVPGVIVAGVTIDAGTVESPVLLQVGKKDGKNELRRATRRTRPRCRTCTSASADRTSARPTSRSRSTATTS